MEAEEVAAPPAIRRGSGIAVLQLEIVFVDARNAIAARLQIARVVTALYGSAFGVGPVASWKPIPFDALAERNSNMRDMFTRMKLCSSGET